MTISSKLYFRPLRGRHYIDRDEPCSYILCIVLQVAQEDQKTFTDLVRQLVGRCSSDVEKARTIFRWITVKNLNNIQFDDNLRGDSPLGLLRGIKHGTESYHVLFKRLCRYVALEICSYTKAWTNTIH